MRSRILTFAVLVLTFVAMRSGILVAHHSRAEYGNQDKKMQGTVVEYRWRNPHVIVFWDVTDESGKVVHWTGEMAAITSMMRDGMTKDSLKTGDKIALTVRPSKAGTPDSVIREILKSDGTVVYSASDAALAR